MNNQPIDKEALRKCKRRAMETADEREVRLSKDRERKKQRVEQETEEERAKRLEYQRRKSKQRRAKGKENCDRQLRPRIGKPQQGNREAQHRPEQLNRNVPQHQLNKSEEPLQSSKRSGETSQDSHSNTRQTFEQLPAAEL